MGFNGWSAPKVLMMSLIGYFALISMPANAALLTATEAITESGQSFSFAFNNADLSDSAGVLTLEALGDYSPTPPSSEVLSIDIEGIFSDFAFDPTRGATIGSDLFQNSASQSFSISSADMLAITSDSLITITLQNSAQVNFFQDQLDDFVRVTLSYDSLTVPVPAPSPLVLLFAASLAGLAGARRQGNRTNSA